MDKYSRIFDSAADKKIPDHAPDCLRCRHFRITWEPSFPRACTLFGFKSHNLPSMEMYISAGKHCYAFEMKDLPEASSSE